MQAFLSDFVDLPGLFHQVDCLNISLSTDSPPVSCPEIELHLSHLADISTRLDRWEHSLESPQYSQKHADDRPISYPSVTMANIFTHLWAFKIIVIQEMAILKVAYSGNVSSPSAQPRDETNDRTTTISLAKKITLSMEYLLKEEMGLFGPASSSYPLRVAWDVLKASGDDYYQDHIERIVQRLIDRGLLSAPTLVFGSDLD